MVDIKRHCIIDMIESRERSDVVKWLSGYPNIKIVSRDGLISYASVIREAHPDVIQINDRFYLIQNITEKASQCFQRIFQGGVPIPITSETQKNRNIMKTRSRRDKICHIKTLLAEGRTYIEVHAMTGSAISTIKKYNMIDETKIPI